MGSALKEVCKGSDQCIERESCVFRGVCTGMSVREGVHRMRVCRGKWEYAEGTER